MKQQHKEERDEKCGILLQRVQRYSLVLGLSIVVVSSCRGFFGVSEELTRAVKSDSSSSSSSAPRNDVALPPRGMPENDAKKEIPNLTTCVRIRTSNVGFNFFFFDNFDEKPFSL